MLETVYAIDEHVVHNDGSERTDSRLYMKLNGARVGFGNIRRLWQPNMNIALGAIANGYVMPVRVTITLYSIGQNASVIKREVLTTP